MFAPDLRIIRAAEPTAIPPPGTLCAYCRQSLKEAFCIKGGRYYHARCGGSL